MNKPDFVYTTYIKTTPEKVWSAITTPEFTSQYWGGNANFSDWKKGSKWTHGPGGNENAEPGCATHGEVLETNPPHRLVITWTNPENDADVSRVTFVIEKMEEMVRLTVTHGDFKANSTLPDSISWGWPLVLSSMKSYLESGQGVDLGAAARHDNAEDEAA